MCRLQTIAIKYKHNSNLTESQQLSTVTVSLHIVKEKKSLKSGFLRLSKNPQKPKIWTFFRFSGIFFVKKNLKLNLGFYNPFLLQP